VLSRLVRWLTAAFALSAMTGCFEYVPAQLDAIPAGGGVQLRLSARPAELAEVSSDAGLVVRGTLVRRDASGVYLRIPVTVRRQGFEAEPIEQEVSIPPGQVIEVEQRRRSSTRTALLVAGTAGVAAIVIGSIIDGHGRRDLTEVPPPEELRVPLGR
jgi:hypothetical protein